MTGEDGADHFDALDALPPGATIGGYAVRRVIGHGGFGITYEAHNRVTGRAVAIKEFFPSSMVRRDGHSRLIYSKVNQETIAWALRKFEETTTTLCGLSHPNIVQVHDYVPMNDTGYMIMELLDGQTLKDWLKARPAPPRLDELRPLLDPVMAALGYVHGRGLVHRDIAPDNILITREGRPVLIDFGSVSRDLSDARQQGLSSTVGLTKRHYTAPEQMRAKARPTVEADVYSMGAVLYRALTGIEPADGQERVDAIFNQQLDPFRSIAERRPAVCDPSSAAMIDSALGLRPGQRPGTMKAMSDGLWPRPPERIAEAQPDRLSVGAKTSEQAPESPRESYARPTARAMPVREGEAGKTPFWNLVSVFLIVSAAVVILTLFALIIAAAKSKSSPTGKFSSSTVISASSKHTERLDAGLSAQTSSGAPASAVAQRAALLADAPEDPQRVRTYVGTVVWHLDSVSPGGGQPLASAVKADIDIPDAKLKLTMLLQKNPEPKLPASHTIEFHFLPQPGNTLGPVKQVNVPEMRRDDDAPTGNPLAGVPVAIADNYFLVGLTRGAAENQNIRLMTERNWFDMSVLFSSGKLAKLTFEKGSSAPILANYLQSDPTMAHPSLPLGKTENIPATPSVERSDDSKRPTAIGSKPLDNPKTVVDPFPEAKRVHTFVVRPNGTFHP